MLKTRRSGDRLIFIMGILIPGKDGLFTETGWGWGCRVTINIDGNYQSTCLFFTMYIYKNIIEYYTINITINDSLILMVYR